jgi:hypothetical protein
MTALRVGGVFAARTAVESRWTAHVDARPLRDLDPAGSLPRSLVHYLSTCSPQPAGTNSAEVLVLGLTPKAEAPEERGQHGRPFSHDGSKSLAARRADEA